MGRKSRSRRRSKAVPAETEAPGLEAPAPDARRASALSRDLADFLVEFSIVLNKRSMYPAGHPQLHAAAERFAQRLGILLDARQAVVLGVARHRLVIDSVTTDPNNALLRELAHRLHRHRIASVHLARGATLTEIESLLESLSADPQRGDGPLGPRLHRTGPWEHIRLRAVGYDQLALQADADGEAAPDQPEAIRDPWVELARLALAHEGSADDPVADPLVLAHAIDRKSGEVAYDRVVLGYLTQIAEEISGRKGSADDQLGERISNLIKALDPEALRQLLASGGTASERRRFALNASQVLAADAVMEVVKAAAAASQQSISHNLLRLLTKLAHHAESGPIGIRAEADGALRTNVARLIGDWELDDPNPDHYTAILEGMVRHAPTDQFMDARSGCAPEILVKMALELDSLGPAVYGAVEELLFRRELPRLAELLKASPHTPTAEKLWQHIATPERLEHALAASPMDQESVAILVDRIGASATNSLIDRLASAEDRSTRAAIMKQLQALGPGVGKTAVARLPDAPWFLQRNILVLLGKRGSWPAGFSPMSYAVHADARIRREGIKLLLDMEAHHDEAVMMGLGDADEGIVGLALASALKSCPADALPIVKLIAADPKRPSEMRVAAVRILARTRAPEALQLLAGIAVTRRLWFRTKLAPKSPELLATLSALAAHWPEDPIAASVLAQAHDHPDPEIRAAARQSAA
ncbi:MAG TPA: hypothetical protein VF252_10020 [Gemmatimonadales bacterium]